MSGSGGGLTVLVLGHFWLEELLDAHVQRLHTAEPKGHKAASSEQGQARLPHGPIVRDARRRTSSCEYWVSVVAAWLMRCSRPLSSIMNMAV